MITNRSVYLAVRQAILMVIKDTNFTVIKDKQDSPEPLCDYCNVFVGRFRSITGYQRTKTADELDVHFKDEERQAVMVSLKFFKENGVEYAETFKQAIRRPNVLMFLEENGLYLQDTSDVRDFTSVIGSGFNPRGQLDIYLTFTRIDEYSVERIKSVDGEGTYQIGDVEIPVNFDTRNHN